MSEVFVYTELQAATPFAAAPWRDLNMAIRDQPGLRNKTWLAGHGTPSLGGFYEFDGIENARRSVTGYFPAEAARFGVPQTSRMFDGDIVEAASRYMGSVHFGARLSRAPSAFVYTEVSVGIPFDQVPWRQMNPVLKAQPGILAKTWLSGVNTHSAGGIYAFESVGTALRFATVYFPTEAAGLGAAFATRVFDAAPVVEASRDLHSPFFA